MHKDLKNSSNYRVNFCRRDHFPIDASGSWVQTVDEKEGGHQMEAVCLFDIMGLSEGTLRKLLPKAPSRMIVCLLTAYPRAIGRLLLVLLSETLKPTTLQFLKDQMNIAPLPTLHQIREAEQEMLKIINEEHLFTDADDLILPETKN